MTSQQLAKLLFELMTKPFVQQVYRVAYKRIGTSLLLILRKKIMPHVGLGNGDHA